MSRVNRRVQARSILSGDPDGSGVVRLAGGWCWRRQSAVELSEENFEARSNVERSRDTSSGRRANATAPQPLVVVVRGKFPGPAVPRGLATTCQEKARGTSRNIVP